ncbi:MAG: 5'/3'-nucleotidase SurE [Firmicutes bacterium]|nr:5'/3'-nucleotidase SurE [Bacillota bacterium]
MNILVVNDDGYLAPGIETLVKAMALFGNVYVAAPKEGQSTKSMSITIKENINVFYPEPIVGAKHMIVVEGTPADCVGVALKAFNVDFDLCVSGINYGHNVATDIFYSGTVGAAREAKFLGIPAIAFSAAAVPNLEYLFDETVKLMDEMKESELYVGTYVLNINFPKAHVAKPLGVKITKLGKRHQHSDFSSTKDGLVFVPNYGVTHYLEEDESDIKAIENGYVSITPLSLDNTNQEAIEKILNHPS